ncbi:MAG: hypothetical protein ACK4ZD_13735 [Caldimonas sp.]|uniref:hypothetical protein n=1 Tax=Caldimonas sp. TaxID=2838790 RepID=UPI00391C7A12
MTPHRLPPGPAKLSRRRVLHWAAASAGAATLGPLLSACGGGGGGGDETMAFARVGGEIVPVDASLQALCELTTATTVTVRFTAGDAGAPNGFVLQWMNFAAWEAANYNWEGFCETQRTQALAPGESVDVTVGEEGDGCGPLACGTKYLFRAASLREPVEDISVQEIVEEPEDPPTFTETVYCQTLDCGPTGQCTYTIGYWRTHGPVPTGNNSNEWPVTSLMLGSVVYTDLQLLAILQQPVAGNGLVSLAHQLIGAKLNVANGADASAIATAIAQADFLIAGRVVPPVGSDTLRTSQVSALVEALTAYNEGGTGPGHCG